MKSIHVLRKPCSAPTVAANVLRYGTGGLDINTTRIAHSNPSDLDSHRKMVEAIKSRGGHMAHSWKNSSDLSGANDVSTAGRWPANLVLQHLDGCVQDGVKKVKGQNPKYANEGRGAGKGERVYGVGPRPAGIGIGHADPDGTETVAAWVCVEGCPVAALDAQSGNVKGAVSNGKKAGTGYKGEFRGQEQTPGYGDTGGASRFFKQVKP